MTGPDTSTFLSPTTGKSPVHATSLIRRLCFVNLENDPETLAFIEEIKEKWPDIELVHSPTGEEYIGSRDVIFYFKDFSGEHFNRIAEEHGADHPGTRIVGFPYVKSRLSEETLYCPKPKRPLHNVHMSSVIVILSSDLHREKKVYARHVQYMGGRVKRDIQGSVRALPKENQKTAIFVGKELIREQRTAAFMEIHTLKPEWVEYCWSHRFDSSLNVLDEKLLERYAMGVFEGLRIFFIGFSESDVNDMTKNVTAKGGSIVADVKLATHIVCDPTYNELKNIEISENQMAVTDHWLWQSLNVNRCLNEDNYFLKDYPDLCRMANSYGRVKSTGSLADCERSKGSDDFSSDDLETCNSPLARTPRTPATPISTKGYDKRQQVVLELLETERNYITALNLALKLRTMIYQEWISKEGETAITKTDLQLIFGKIPAIVNVHNTILQKVQAHVDSWDKTNNTATPHSSKKNVDTYDIADMWISEKNKMQQAYPPFINSYESIKQCFEQADQKHPRFHTFIRSKESDPEFNRNKLNDLIIRPVQRLPSVILLLKELQKRTNKQSQINRLSDAVSVLQQVLTNANQLRFKTDSKIAHLTKFIDMDKVPDHLVCSRRVFLAEMDAVSITGTGGFQKWQKIDVRILLFNDVVVVCKTRDQTSHSPPGLHRKPTGTMSRLKKQTSLSTLRKSYKKPLKYIKHIPIQHVRDIRSLCDIQENENASLLYYPSPSGAPLQVITVREDISQDLVWIIHPTDKNAMNELFAHTQQQIMMEFGRQIRSAYGAYPLSELLEHYPEVDDILRKYLKRIRENNHNATMNYTMSRGGSLLRRAISSASMSVANRLSKMTSSRSNLREIMEAPSHETSAEAMRRAPNTPLYDIHPRSDAYSSPIAKSSPNILASSEFATPITPAFATPESPMFGTPKRSLRSRFSTMNLFRRPSTRQCGAFPDYIHEEDKEN